MQSYSIKRMRKECQGLFRLFFWTSALFFLNSAFLGALWKTLDHGETKDALLVIGCFLAISLLILGAYFVVSDPKWLTKHTLFGKEMTRLGDAVSLMRDIDREAETMEYECHSFALMKHWLVLYDSASRRTWGGAQIQSRPIPVRQLTRIVWAPHMDQENEGFWVRIETIQGESIALFVWELADILALRIWGGRLREKQEL